MPPPEPWVGALNWLKPLRMVNPCRTELAVSLLAKMTTAPFALPSIMVTEGPPELVTVMALPLKLIFST